MEDLPRPLALLSASLSREALALTTAGQLQRAVRQSGSSLSFVRQDAYAQIATLLEDHLADPSAAASVLKTLLSTPCWDVLLRNLRTGLGTVGASAGPANASPHSTAEQELVTLLSVVQVACMVHPTAKRTVCDTGLPQLMLDRLPAAQPALVCACLDTLLCVQLSYPPAFQLLVELQGIQQVSRLIKSSSAPEKVRSWGARFLNLTLTHVGPALVEAAGGGGEEGGGAEGEEGGGASAAALQQSLETARAALQEVLGRDVAALMMRKVNLADRQAESKLEQLGPALALFYDE